MQNMLDIRYSNGVDKHTTKAIYRYDKGLKLRFSNIPQSTMVQVHYAVLGMTNSLQRVTVLENGYWISTVPNVLLAQLQDVHAYVYLTDSNSGYTVLDVTIPIKDRPKPDDYEYSTEEINEFNQVMFELSKALTAIDKMTVTCESVDSNSNPSVNITTENGVKNISFGIPSGKTGAPGITPHIGENGNWFIGNNDTGVQAQGPTGKNGSVQGIEVNNEKYMPDDNGVIKLPTIGSGDVRCKTNEEWLADTDIVKSGEIIVYVADETRPRPMFKVGDGKTLAKNLPFVDGIAAQSIALGPNTLALQNFDSTFGFELNRVEKSSDIEKTYSFGPRINKSTGEIQFKTSKEKEDGSTENIFQTAWTSHFPAEKTVKRATESESINTGSNKLILNNYGTTFGFELNRTENNTNYTFSPRIDKNTGKVQFKTVQKKEDGSTQNIFQDVWTSHFPAEKTVAHATDAVRLVNNGKSTSLFEYGQQLALISSFENQGDNSDETYVLEFRLNKADGTIQAKTTSAAGDKLVTLYTAGDQGYRPTAGSIQGLIEHIKSVAIAKKQGTEYAGRLFYVAPDGGVQHLVLGEEFQIVNGVLHLATGYTPSTFDVAESGEATMSGMTISDEGDATITSGTLVVDENGNATI